MFTWTNFFAALHHCNDSIQESTQKHEQNKLWRVQVGKFATKRSFRQGLPAASSGLDDDDDEEEEDNQDCDGDGSGYDDGSSGQDDDGDDGHGYDD